MTTEWIAGYEVETIMGAVVGVSPHSISPYLEGMRSLADGQGVSNTERMDLMRRCREEAIEMMAYNARKIGANAVIAMRMDHRLVTEVWNEICAYGTAVRAVPAVPAPASRRKRVSSVETMRL
ncbi:YbjQ family protein [Hamadaea flava]|uniref:YbjQ family protein n=1 Tax=Hamadaea flava TaxID=1742688 RepID=UPI0020A43101|nr:heavy metal-binding domain-containing protein [Hamadaea flava]